VTSTKSFVVGALIAAIAMSALGATTTAAGNASAQSRANTFAGSWDVIVDRAAPQSDLRSLQTFTSDGSVVEIANGGTALRSPSHGSWERIAGHQYASTIVFFRYDPLTGAYLGTQKVNSALELSPDGGSFTGVALSTLYDAAGNVVVAGLRAEVAGVRIQVERVD
jgi:hypothetical protein